MEENEKLNIDLDFLDRNDSRETSRAVYRTEADNEKDVSNNRPWIRYWARYLDIIIFSLFLGIFLGIFAPSILDSSDIFLTMLILFVWIFAESVCLSSWGTTPGKWLLRTHLKDSNGNKLSFSVALNRSFAVWLRGMGTGFPIVTLFTLISSYNNLAKTGTTSWDKEGGFIVTHNKVGFIRATVAVCIFIVWVLIISS